jgi:heme-degrading monooxygenase HmoA
MSGIVRAKGMPYYAVIFTSIRTKGDNGYSEMADEIVKKVKLEKGFLGSESFRDKNGFGVTISYWENLESIKKWSKDEKHMIAKERGKKNWYEEYTIRISKIESNNDFVK